MGQEQDYEMETQNDILTKAKADYPKRAPINTLQYLCQISTVNVSTF